MNKRIFALIGKKHVGKDTVAKIIQKKLGGNIYHFADSLKDFSRKTCGLFLGEEFRFTDENKDKLFLIPHQQRDYIEFKYEKDVCNPTICDSYNNIIFSPRKLLQSIGMLLRDTFDKDIFIKKVINDIQENPNNVSIIADLRFKNEAEKLRNKFVNIIFIKIVKPSLFRDEHVSETELEEIKYDILIENDSDLVSLISKIENICDNV